MLIVFGIPFFIFWTNSAGGLLNHWLEQNEEWVIIFKENQKNKEFYKFNSENL